MTTSSPPPASGQLQRYLAFLEQDPDNLSLIAEVFELALQAGEIEIAEPPLCHARRLAPDAPAWLHRQARLDMARQRYAQADAMLAQLQAQGIDDAALQLQRACCAFFQRDFLRASQILLPLREDAGALPLLLRSLHQLGEVGQALQCFEACLARAELPVEAVGIASLLAVDAGQLPQARAWAERALQSDPRQKEALLARASVALAAQDVDAAERDLRACIDHFGNEGRVHAALGTSCLLRQQPEDALPHFRAAVAQLPAHIGSWHGLGWCELLAGRVEAAMRSFASALALDRNVAQSHGAMAVALAMRGCMQEAHEHLGRALRLEPGNLAAQYAQAIISGAVHDRQAFIGFVKRACGSRTLEDGRLLSDVVLRSR